MPLKDFIEQARLAELSSRVEELPWPDTLIWAWVWFRFIYVAYGMLFEAFLAATPGKRLTGCTVRAESLDPPNKVQIVIRNVTKLIELEPLLKIWPFVLIIFFTRNHQRVGDLLARTIVVVFHETPEEPGQTKGDSGGSGEA